MTRTAKKPKPSAPYPRWPVIPDEIWLPFVVSLNGDPQHDSHAIASLAHIFDVDPDAIRFRLMEELADCALQAEATLH